MALKKKYLIDTSVIMDNFKALKSISDGGSNEIYLTDVILSEIDGHKSSKNPELGFAAREFVRSFRMDSFKDSRRKPVDKERDYICRAFVSVDGEDVPVYIVSRSSYQARMDTNDKKILEVAKDYGLRLITNDASFRVMALAEKVPAESLIAGSVENPDEISFYKEVETDSLESWSSSPEKEGMSRWGQISVRDRNSGRTGLYVANGTSFIPLNDAEWSKDIVQPVNVEQKFYSHILRNHNGIIVVSGSTGSGKTLLAVQEGIRRVSEGKVGGIVYMRYTVNAGDKFSELGYRKGGEEEKLSYYNYPLYGAINFILEQKGGKGKKEGSTIGKSREVVEFMNKYNIEAIDIAHARGTTITNRFVIFDELQNTPLSILKLIGTRIGKGSTLVLMGDYNQVDHPYLSKNRNSLVFMLNKAKSDPEVAGILLKKTVRSDTARWFQYNM